MASVTELLAAQEAEKSPLIKLLEGTARGFNHGQNEFYNNAFKIVETQRRQQEMQLAQAAEQRKAAQRAKQAQDDQAIQSNFRSVGGKGSPVLPVQKLQRVEDEEGNVTTSTIYGNDDRSDRGISTELLYRMGQDQQKAEKEAKAKEIPGYTRTGEVEVDDIETRNLRQSVPEFETFKTAINDYRNLIKKYGTQEITDRRVQGTMNALAKNLQLKVKNLAQLGVLSASDVPFIEEQIPSPGLFKSASGMLGALDTAEKLMQTAINNKMRVGGYQAKGGASQSSGVQAGAVEDGYRFKGGDPADPNNWEKQ